MHAKPEYFEKGAPGFLRRLAGVAALIGLLSVPSFLARSRQTQTVGPSFPCDQAKTGVEKLICSDGDLSALDLEYGRAYEKELKAKNKNEAEGFKSSGKFSLKSRNACVDEKVDKLDGESRPSSALCVANWYYLRIAELSDLPTPAPVEWTQRLIGGVRAFTTPNQGLPGAEARKPVPVLYFKSRDGEKLLKWLGNFEGAQPANMKWEGVYYVYENVLGSLTYVANYGAIGKLDHAYYFNKDGRLAAQERTSEAKSGSKIYVEQEIVFYGRDGQETRRVLPPYYDGKRSAIRKELSPPRLEKPFDSFTSLSDTTFKNAEAVEADRWGVCVIELSDGYGPRSRILNILAQPLEVYRTFLPPMNLRTFDAIYPVRGRAPGILEPLGSLDGKKVYTVKYSGGLTGVLVEREANRFLPVLYVNPELKIDRLEVMRIGGEDVLAYSTTISGNGHFTEDFYFVLENGVSKSIHYQPVLADELKRILPPGYGVRKGGGFDGDTFVFSNSVWKDGDANCCPSGGSVEVVLGVEKGHFVVKSSRYEKPK